ncbi:hypothetical protein OAO01_02330 [Oligoflexia bacterium]|nr:hypothetical protein [Oligoflexia bacterium]
MTKTRQNGPFGAVLPLLALLLVPIIGFIALSVGISIYGSFMNDMQRATQMAALGGLSVYIDEVRQLVESNTPLTDPVMQDVAKSARDKAAMVLRTNFLEDPSRSRIKDPSLFHTEVSIDQVDEGLSDVSAEIQFGRIWFDFQVNGDKPPCGELHCFEPLKYSAVGKINAMRVNMFIPDNNRWMYMFARVLGQYETGGARSETATLSPINVNLLVDASESVVDDTYSRSGLGVNRFDTDSDGLTTDPPTLCSDANWDVSGFSDCQEFCNNIWTTAGFGFPVACQNVPPNNGKYWWANACCTFSGSSLSFANRLQGGFFNNPPANCAIDMEYIDEVKARAGSPSLGQVQIAGIESKAKASTFRGARKFDDGFPNWVLDPLNFGLMEDTSFYQPRYRFQDEYFCHDITFKGENGEPDVDETYLIHYGNKDAADWGDFRSNRANPQPLLDILLVLNEALQILMDNQQLENKAGIRFYDDRLFEGARHFPLTSPSQTKYFDYMVSLDYENPVWERATDKRSFIVNGLFPREGAFTDGRKAIIQGMNDIIATPNAGVARNVILHFSDNMFNCDEVTGCGNTGKHVLDSMNEMLGDNILIKTLLENKIKVHMFALGKSANTIIARSKLSKGCMVASEARLLNLPDYAISNYEYYQGNSAAVVNNDFNDRYTNNFLLANVLWRWAKAVDSEYLPLKDCLRDGAGKCVPFVAEANAKCDALSGTYTWGVPIPNMEVDVGGLTYTVTTAEGIAKYNMEGLSLRGKMQSLVKTLVKNPIFLHSD